MCTCTDFSGSTTASSVSVLAQGIWAIGACPAVDGERVGLEGERGAMGAWERAEGAGARGVGGGGLLLMVVVGWPGSGARQRVASNTNIQNIIKDGTLPKYDRTNMCFVLINEREESSQVSSIVSNNKLGYVKKLPFKPLPMG